MIDTCRALFVLGAILLPVLSACRSGDDRSAMHRGMMARLDTTRLQEVYKGIEKDYDQLMARHEEMRAQMPASVQQLYEQMQQMRGEASAMHQQMMQGGTMHEEGMMDRDTGMMGQGTGMMSMREWDHQMMGMHEEMAQIHERAGQDEMAQMHRQITQRYQEALEVLPSDSLPTRSPKPQEDGVLSGETLYAQQCATCHGSEGSGRGRAFPPLAGAEWVTGDAKTPIRILLHGLQGRIQVDGTTYSGAMPAFGSRLSDGEIAAILTYLRTSWGNEAPEVTAGEVQKTRREYSGRTRPWSPSELQ